MCKAEETLSYIISTSISGLVVEYIVAIDVTRVPFPADAWAGLQRSGAVSYDERLLPRVHRL